MSNTHKTVVVQKFGGTSVGTGKRMLDVAKIVQNSLKHDNVVVVLSAMSSYVKAEGTTTRLINAATAAVNQQTKEFEEIIATLRKSHLEAVVEALGEGEQTEALKKEIERDLEELKSFLHAIQIIGELSTRSYDVVIGLGEKLSAKIFAAVLNHQGVNAEYVNLENIVGRSSRQEEAEKTVDQAFFDVLRKRLAERVKLCGNKVPVVTGFFGPVPGGILEAVGRGYTDFTAAMISAGLQAREWQVWKEVDGIFSADPRKVKSARLLKRITPPEAAELTFYGSEVIHPFSMEQVINAKVPIRIKNTFSPELDGTVIDPLEFAETPTQKRGPVAVTAKRDVTVVNLHSNRKLLSHGFFAKVFSILDKHGLSVDMIATSEVDISLTLAKTKRLPEAVNELATLGEVSVLPNMAILSVVGHRMKHTVGLAGAIFTALAGKGVNLEMISQGASEINVSCVVREAHADAGLQVLHDEIILQHPRSPADGTEEAPWSLPHAWPAQPNGH
eukprot:Colp12_sorted_trinity150504_noHs@9472